MFLNATNGWRPALVVWPLQRGDTEAVFRKHDLSTARMEDRWKELSEGPGRWAAGGLRFGANGRASPMWRMLPHGRGPVQSSSVFKSDEPRFLLFGWQTKFFRRPPNAPM